MAQVAERVDTLSPMFDAFRRDPAFGAGGLGTARSAAFERFLTRLRRNGNSGEDAEGLAELITNIFACDDEAALPTSPSPATPEP